MNVHTVGDMNFPYNWEHFGKYFEKHENDTLKILPTDKEEAEKLIKCFYRKLHLAEPVFKWHPSPISLFKGADKDMGRGCSRKTDNMSHSIFFMDWFEIYAIQKVAERYSKEHADSCIRPLYGSGGFTPHAKLAKIFRSRIKGELLRNTKIDEPDIEYYLSKFWFKYSENHLISLRYMVEELNVDIEPFYRLADYCFGFIPLSGICLVCENPSRISFQEETEMLHNPDEAAYAFSDGFSLHFINGKYVAE